MALRLFLPFFVFGLAAVAAAVHKALGEPLGPTAAAKLADLWQQMALASLVYAPILGQYRRQHALAQRNEQRQLGGADANPTLTGKEAAPHDHDDDGPRPRTRAR